jgi:hypothetical protein
MLINVSLCTFREKNHSFRNISLQILLGNKSYLKNNRAIVLKSVSFVSTKIELIRENNLPLHTMESQSLEAE